MAAGSANGSSPKEYRVLVVGSPKVGKTSLIQRFLFNDFSYDVPPSASEERKVVMIGQNKVPLLICDLIDRTDLATRGYYANTHAIIFVYDITNPETLFDSSTWIKDLKIYLNEQLSSGLPLLFVGNKLDLVKDVLDYPEAAAEGSEGDQSGDGEAESTRPDYATLRQAKNILKRENFPVKQPDPIQCSALNGTNVNKVFETVAKRLAGVKSSWCGLL